MRVDLEAFGRRPLRGALLFLAMPMTVSICYGFQYRVGADHAFAYYLTFSAIFVLALVLLTWDLLASKGESTGLAAGHGWFGFVLMTASFTLTLFFQSKVLAPMPWHVAAAAAGLLGFFFHAKWKAPGSTRFFLCAAMAFLVLVIARTEVWQKGDMLLWVVAAGKELLAGRQPYRAYPEVYGYLAGMLPSEVVSVDRFVALYHNAKTPLSYLPGIWLAYIPSVVLGMDPRILNVVFVACIVLVFERLLPLGDKRSVVLSLTFYPVLLSPAVLGLLSALHVVHYWLLLLLTLHCVQGKRYGIASVLFGLALATRQLALFLAAPLLAYLALELEWRALLRYASVTLGVYLVATVPFAIWWGEGGMFWKYLYLGFTSLSEDIYLVEKQIGVAGLLARTGLVRSAVPIQIGIVLLAAAYVFVRKSRDPVRISQVLGITYIWVVLFNPYAVRYTYYGGFFLFLSGLTIALAAGRPDSSARRFPERITPPRASPA